MAVEGNEVIILGVLAYVHGSRAGILQLLGGGGALYWFKLRKPKADTRGADDLDDYDYGEDEEDEDYEFEAEDETDAGEDEEK